jgi:hemoglobin-like flavoprotein
MRAVRHHLDNPDWLVAALGSLGAQHAEWGVTESMYGAFIECMLSFMAEVAGPGWTPANESEWRGTLGNITTLMLAGAGSTG